MKAGPSGSDRARPGPATGESLPAPVRTGSHAATAAGPVAAGLTLPLTPGSRDGQGRP
jgi:hypothetical protein